MNTRVCATGNIGVSDFSISKTFLKNNLRLYSDLESLKIFFHKTLEQKVSLTFQIILRDHSQPRGSLHIFS